DERVDAGSRDAGDDRAVMRPDPALCRQRVGDSRPAVPLIVERRAGMHHGATLRQEHIVDRPIEAASAAQPRHVPAARYDLDLGAREKAAPVEWPSLGAEARFAVVEDLE